MVRLIKERHPNPKVIILDVFFLELLYNSYQLSSFHFMLILFAQEESSFSVFFFLEFLYNSYQLPLYAHFVCARVLLLDLPLLTNWRAYFVSSFFVSVVSKLVDLLAMVKGSTITFSKLVDLLVMVKGSTTSLQFIFGRLKVLKIYLYFIIFTITLTVYNHMILN